MSNTMEDTMAEAFCEEYLITWTEHSEDFTGWLHRDISTRSNLMSRAGAINLFHQLVDNSLLIVTVFPDRSWIVHHEPTDGAPPTLGTREDEHRILDLIHQALETWLEYLTKKTWMDVVAVLSKAKQMSQPEPEPKPEPKPKPQVLLACPDTPREPRRRNRKNRRHPGGGRHEL